MSLVGHNIKNFDLPFLLRRAWSLEVPVPGYLTPSGRRYWPDIFVDTMDLWSCGVFGPDGRVSLDRLSKHFGLEGKNGSGENFHVLLEEDPEAAKEYALQDTRLTRGVHRKMLRLAAPEPSEGYLYFDIETGPAPDEHLEWIAPDFDEREVKTGNLGVEKALEKIQAARSSHLSRIRQKAALHAEYGQIKAIAYIHEDGTEEFDVGDEKGLVSRFWELALLKWRGDK